MLADVIRVVRDPDVQRRALLAAILLSGGAPFTGCYLTKSGNLTTFCWNAAQPSACDDPPVNLHDPNFHAGATVSVRTPAAGDNGVTLFARTGVLAPIDASSSAAMPALGGPVATTGTANLRENVTVPLYGGVTIPAKNVGVPIQNLSFEAFGGADIKSEHFGFSLTQAGGGAAAASTDYWTADPAFGAGIQYYLGTFYGVPTSFGAAYIVDMQLGSHSATAPSPTIAGLNYTLTNPNHISGTAAFTLNFDISPH